LKLTNQPQDRGRNRAGRNVDSASLIFGFERWGNEGADRQYEISNTVGSTLAWNVPGAQDCGTFPSADGVYVVPRGDFARLGPSADGPTCDLEIPMRLFRGSTGPRFVSHLPFPFLSTSLGTMPHKTS